VAKEIWANGRSALTQVRAMDLLGFLDRDS
jgi:hypothetical protein